MSKISITGTRKDLDIVIDRLYDLEVLDIDEYEGELETGMPSDEADKLSELLVDIRSTLSKLPDVDGKERNLTVDELKKNLPEIDEDIETAKKRIDDVGNEIDSLKEDKKFFERLKGSNLKCSNLEGSDNLSVFVGKIDKSILSEKAPNDRYELIRGKDASVVFYHNKYEKEFERVLNEVAREHYKIPNCDYEEEVESVAQKLNQKIEDKKKEAESYRQKLHQLSEEWRKGLESVEEFLSQRVEKAEAPIEFAMTENAFIAYGWVPTSRLEEIKAKLGDATNERVHIEEEDEEGDEEPPVKHQNNKVVRPFESLTDLVDVPRYGEVDPSFLILLTFPLFFGLMIGDAGYGITTAIVFYAGMKMFPQVSEIFKALLWTSAATFIFGLIYGEMFGFQIYESPFYRADWWTEIFYLTIGIGVAHVNLGLLIGAYNEYIHHGIMEAIFAKISWMLLQVAAVAGYLTATSYGTVPGTAVLLGIAIPTVLMLYKGEGVEGIVEIPSLISNVLSYLRLFGVCMAAYTLAGTANAVAGPAFASGGILGIAVGTLILIVSHIILTFIKIMEGFLQGIRLHYVEMFGWFFEGGGKKYAPFGAREIN